MICAFCKRMPGARDFAFFLRISAFYDTIKAKGERFEQRMVPFATKEAEGMRSGRIARRKGWRGLPKEKMIERPVSTNHNTGLLGVLAVVFMIIDHVGVVFFPGAMGMRIAGRMALPLFAWGIAIGAEHTRNIRRYALRLLLMLFISQPFFNGALNHRWDEKLNIFATLFLGLVAIWGLKEKKEWMTVAALLLAQFVPMDYGLRGVLCILLFWALRDNPLALAVCFGVYCVMWGEGGSVILTTSLFKVRMQTAALLTLPLILWPCATRTRTPKWLMYAAYPGHLAVLWLLKNAL